MEVFMDSGGFVMKLAGIFGWYMIKCRHYFKFRVL